MSPDGPSANRWLIAIAVMSSAVMEVLDTSVVNVSLPHIAGSTSASVDEATWVLTSYLIANAVILPISGWLANFIGRKRLLLTVVSGFTISSVLCGLAPSLGTLIFFRVLQGTTGGGLQPLSQAVAAGGVPARGARPGDGALGTGHRGRPHPGSDVGWLDYGYLLLALGVLHQRADRHLQPDHDFAFSSTIPRTSAAGRCAWTCGDWACWRWAWRRCKSCWTKARRRIGSAPTLS